MSKNDRKITSILEKIFQTTQKLQRLGDRMSPSISKGGETDVQLLTCRKSLNTVTGNIKGEEYLEQFTFYDLYADVINQLTDEEAGRFCKRVLTYTIFEKENVPSKSETENCFWEIVLPTLEDATQIERNGKIPYYLNRQMKHFAFKAAYARMIVALKEDILAGKFIKAICTYMFEDQEPVVLDAPIDSYFRLFRKSFDLSKNRSESGRKGGLVKKNIS